MPVLGGFDAQSEAIRGNPTESNQMGRPRNGVKQTKTNRNKPFPPFVPGKTRHRAYDLILTNIEWVRRPARRAGHPVWPFRIARPVHFQDGVQPSMNASRRKSESGRRDAYPAPRRRRRAASARCIVTPADLLRLRRLKFQRPSGPEIRPKQTKTNQNKPISSFLEARWDLRIPDFRQALWKQRKGSINPNQTKKCIEVISSKSPTGDLPLIAFRIPRFRLPGLLRNSFAQRGVLPREILCGSLLRLVGFLALIFSFPAGKAANVTHKMRKQMKICRKRGEVMEAVGGREIRGYVWRL